MLILSVIILSHTRCINKSTKSNKHCKILSMSEFESYLVNLITLPWYHFLWSHLYNCINKNRNKYFNTQSQLRNFNFYLTADEDERINNLLSDNIFLWRSNVQQIFHLKCLNNVSLIKKRYLFKHLKIVFLELGFKIQWTLLNVITVKQK